MKGITTLILLFAVSTMSLAQFSTAFKYFHGIPQGDFKKKLSKHNSAMSAEILFKTFKSKNLYIGGTLSMGYYQDDNLSLGIIEPIEPVITNEDDQFITYQAILRYFFYEEKSWLRPFAQIQGGGITNYSHFTSSEDGGLNYSYNREKYGSTYLVGLSGGAHLRLVDIVYLHANFGYNFSGNTQYRAMPKSDDIPSQDILLPYPLNESRINHFFLEAGIALNF